MALYSSLVPLFLLFGVIVGMLVDVPHLSVVAVVSYVGFLFLCAHQTPLSRFDEMSGRAARMFVVFLVVFGLLSFGLFFWLLRLSLVGSLFFASLLVVTHAHRFSGSARVREILVAESRFSRLFSLVVPLLVLLAVPSFFSFGVELVLSVGVGVFMGVLLSKVLVVHRRYDSLWSSFVLLVAALLTYSVAEVLEGLGFVAVLSLGLFLYHAPRRLLFERSYDRVLMLVFVLVGVFCSGLFFSLPVSSEQGWVIVGVALVFFVSRFVAALVLRSYFRVGEVLLLAFSPVGASCLVVLFFVHAVLVPLGVVFVELALVTQVCVLLVLASHALSLVLSVVLQK